MEDLKLELEDLKRRWEDGHRQLVLLEAAGDRMHVVVQHKRKLWRFSGSALDLQLAATKKRLRMSSQEALTEGMAAEISLKDIVQGLAASQKALTENMVLIQATTNQLMKQQGELLQAIATPMRREYYNGNNQPSNDECYYCHRKGHFKRDCAALKRAQRNNAELASIARRRHGKRRGDTVKIRKVDANEVHSACLKQQLLLPECLLERVLIGLHNDAGHQALERTEALVRARCYWPRMHDHIKQWIIKCQRCSREISSLQSKNASWQTACI